LVFDDFFAVEPGFDFRTFQANDDLIPLIWLSDLIFCIAFVEPVIEVETDGFVGDPSALTCSAGYSNASRLTMQNFPAKTRQPAETEEAKLFQAPGPNPSLE
jgi:hypothetical protein